MRRTFNNLDRLHQKMLARYGPHDTTVVQLRQELDLCQQQLASDDEAQTLQGTAAAQAPRPRQTASMACA